MEVFSFKVAITRQKICMANRLASWDVLLDIFQRRANNSKRSVVKYYGHTRPQPRRGC